MEYLGGLPSKGLLRRMVNSPEGGGAMERGMLMFVLWLSIGEMKVFVRVKIRWKVVRDCSVGSKAKTARAMSRAW